MYLQAHKLKGASANLGARRLVSFCRKMEEVAQQSDIAPVEALIKNIVEETSILQQLLLAEKQGRK